MNPDLVGNPFAALSLIVAPAILTNASSVLAMSTSNRWRAPSIAHASWRANSRAWSAAADPTAIDD